MKLSMGQISSTDDKVQNLAVIRAQVEQAATAGSDLIIFPEFAMYDLPQPDQRFIENAESLDGPFVSALQQMAAERQIAIIAGTLEKIATDPRPSNTLIAIDSSGSLVQVYRKVHLYNAFGARESDLIRPSDASEAAVFDLAGARIGLQTCYDMRFPEITRELIDAGADLIVSPASWVPGPRKEDHWSVLARARAIENTVFFAAVGQAPPVAIGGSLLVDPMGVVIGELGEQVAVAHFEINPERVQEVRKRNPSVTDRRFEVRRLAPKES